MAQNVDQLFSTILEELEESGFIRRIVSADTTGTNALFQLIDNYTLFFYRCVKKNAFSDPDFVIAYPKIRR